MAPLPSTSLDSLRRASDAEILREINDHLAKLNSSIADFRKAPYAIQAQLLIQELTRRDLEVAGREQRRQSNTMVACTIIITVLTVIVTILTAVMTWVTVYPAK